MGKKNVFAYFQNLGTDPFKILFYSERQPDSIHSPVRLPVPLCLFVPVSREVSVTILIFTIVGEYRRVL